MIPVFRNSNCYPLRQIGPKPPHYIVKSYPWASPGVVNYERKIDVTPKMVLLVVSVFVILLTIVKDD